MFELAAGRERSGAGWALIAAVAAHALLAAALLSLRTAPKEVVVERTDVVIRQPPGRPGPAPKPEGAPPHHPEHPGGHPRPLRPPREQAASAAVAAPDEPARPVESVARAPVGEQEGAPEGVQDGAEDDPAGTRGGGGACSDCAPGGAGPGLAIASETLEWNAPAITRRPRAAESCGAPRMPEQARLMGLTGAVVVRYVVGEAGRAEDIRVVNDALPVLAQAVRAWLEQCAFEPALAGGRPVRTRITQPFFFRLR